MSRRCRVRDADAAEKLAQWLAAKGYAVSSRHGKWNKKTRRWEP